MLGPIKGIIFDLDGTLITTFTDFKRMKIRIIDYLFSEGVDREQLSSNDLTMVILSKAEKMLREKMIPEHKIENIVDHTDDIMNEVEMENVEETRPIEGAEETLRELKSEGYKLAILTRGHHGYAVAALRNTGLWGYFDLILGRGETPKPKPDPEAMAQMAKLLNLGPNEIVFVGDHSTDQTCAEKTGVRFIGVLTGSTKLDTWKDVGCTEVLDSVEDLPEYLIRNACRDARGG